MATKQQLAEAKKLLEEHAPKGEFLAYINKDEAQILKNLGGSGRIVEATQIPSFDIEQTQILPAPVLEGALTAFTKKLQPLIGQEIDTSKYAPSIADRTQLQKGLLLLTHLIHISSKTLSCHHILTSCLLCLLKSLI